LVIQLENIFQSIYKTTFLIDCFYHKQVFNIMYLGFHHRRNDMIRIEI